MKKIYIKICNYNEHEENSYGSMILRILKKKYDVEFSDSPDYIFFNESTYEYLHHDGIRIFYTGENIHPNFNLTDYAFGFNYLTFQDRYYRLPIYLVTEFHRPAEINQSRNLDFKQKLNLTMSDLAKKTDFCSFVYSNYLGDRMREIFFAQLSAYKQVNSGGKFMNTIGGPVKNKLEFEMKHKFSIAFENSSMSGYTTEKLPNAFAAQTIPIYWGNPDIAKEFNTKRFINAHDYPSMEAVIDQVIRLDTDDQLYLQMINSEVCNPEYSIQNIHEGFENFIYAIFDQPLTQAKRRTIHPERARVYEKNELLISKYVQVVSQCKKILALIYSPFKKIDSINRAKQRLLIYLKGKK